MSALAPRHRRWLDRLAAISDDLDLIPDMRPIGAIVAELVAGMAVSDEAFPKLGEKSGTAPEPG